MKSVRKENMKGVVPGCTWGGTRERQKGFQTERAAHTKARGGRASETRSQPCRARGGGGEVGGRFFHATRGRNLHYSL